MLERSGNVRKMQREDKTRYAVSSGCGLWNTILLSARRNPARAAELGRMGGLKNRHYGDADEVKVDAPSTPAEVRNMLSQAMADVRAGKLDPKIANSMTLIANALLKAFELADLEERMARLKDELQGRFEASPGCIKQPLPSRPRPLRIG